MDAYSGPSPAGAAHVAVAYRSSPASSSNRGGGGANSERAWEDLRREARRLEGELESKLQGLSKLSAAFESSMRRHEAGKGGGADQLAQARVSEIESLLQRLSDANDEMGAVIGGSSDARSHTLARHRDVLQEYTQEFRRLDASLGAARSRAELLGGSDGAPLLSVQVHNASGALLRERTQLGASSSYVEDMLAQAASVSKGLAEQRRVFDGVQDSLVLSGVIAGCTVLLLLYIFSKR
ncbi:golgi SNAP receptor complex member [Raphidocelis subcapitata]|uniref:Golgi SNAP receptor complex member n=1 Tax=Raphidocelis subcapitata TaxID=307507 RepID=A0A2V0PD66_9CHLO|nr:golgi SNAP receptor complex member [Raphidocelis subcapitata]|eukprot:GBF95107.1 golgi SNAP receptor complex member [Raphidocelis subcapitata]